MTTVITEYYILFLSFSNLLICATGRSARLTRTQRHLYPSRTGYRCWNRGRVGIGSPTPSPLPSGGGISHWTIDTSSSIPTGGGISHWTADTSSPPNGRGLRGGRSKIIGSLARAYRKPERDGYNAPGPFSRQGGLGARPENRSKPVGHARRNPPSSGVGGSRKAGYAPLTRPAACCPA
jgi:hypothetical protein